MLLYTNIYQYKVSIRTNPCNQLPNIRRIHIIWRPDIRLVIVLVYTNIYQYIKVSIRTNPCKQLPNIRCILTPYTVYTGYYLSGFSGSVNHIYKYIRSIRTNLSIQLP
mgnify:CR=1 FL=1